MNGPPDPDPIKQIEGEQAHMMVLCDMLETIADEISDNMKPSTVVMAARSLRHELPRLHRHEEQLLFPLLAKRALPEDDIEEILDGFRQENAMDEGYAEEVLTILDRLALGQGLENLEMAGYLLRGFFESLRRHLRWENIVILKLARQRLLQEDLVQMSHQLSMEEC
jgi:hemerythrin-like domain-containing protein